MALYIIFLLIASSFILFSFIFTQKPNGKLPPGPPKLPIIGNIHQTVGGLPHFIFRDLAQKYGPIMHLKLGQVSIMVVSSPRLAEEVLKTNDIVVANRPYSLVGDIVLYGSSDVAFGSYGDYWRQMKKIMTVEVLSAKKVAAISGTRQQEVNNLMEFIRSTCGKPFHVREHVMQRNNNIICKSLFGDNCKQQHMLIESLDEMMKLSTGFNVSDLFPNWGFLPVISGYKSTLTRIHKNIDSILSEIFKERKIKRQKGGASVEDMLDVLLNIKERGGLEFPVTDNNIKAIFVNMFVGGTDTSVATIEWAMTEMMRNPKVMAKAQAEVRQLFKGKNTILDKDLQDLVYLKFIIKETLRLHPVVPILLPRECRGPCKIGGYDIPMNTILFVNAFACSTDPEYWDDAESFNPERFENSSLEFNGRACEYLPFGAGRRMCPGITFGTSVVEIILAQLLYYFNWKLPNGLSPNDIDLTPNFGAVADKKVPLQIIPNIYSPIQ